MRQRIRSHLTYANVVATLALFLVIGGGTALASYVVSSNSQVGPGTISGHKPPNGKHSNIIANSINGKDIADRSGVDTCKTPLVIKLGPVCAGGGVQRTYPNAVDYCAGYDLRLPTYSEAIALRTNHDVPGVSGSQVFWADDTILDGNSLQAEVVGEDSGSAYTSVSTPAQTVCVTDPSA